MTPRERVLAEYPDVECVQVHNHGADSPEWWSVVSNMRLWCLGAGPTENDAWAQAAAHLEPPAGAPTTHTEART